MNLLGSRWILMVGVALVIVAGSMALAPAVATQLQGPVGDSAAVLHSSVPWSAYDMTR